VTCDPLYTAPRSHRGGETHPKPRDLKSVSWRKEEDLDLRWWNFFIWGSEELVEDCLCQEGYRTGAENGGDKRSIH